MKEIPLTQGQVALVDDEDYSELSKYKWHAHTKPRYSTYYARRRIKDVPGSRIMLMHTQILGSGVIDHIDGNGLNNTRSNLRFSTTSQNIANSRKWRKKTSSKYKGVYWCNSKKLWVADVKKDRKRRHAGSSKFEKLAAVAYDRKALELFGEFARPNFGHDGHPRFCQLTINHPFACN